jgi:RNA polymerase sigma factor (sigma-70 family)
MPSSSALSPVTLPVCASDYHPSRAAPFLSEDAHERFSQVVPPHLSAARSLARSLSSCRADSEDIIQEACLRAFRGIDQFSGTNARAWLLTIVRRTAYSWIEKHRRTQPLPDNVEQLTDDLVFQSVPATPESALVSGENARGIQRAMSSVPEPFRQTLGLRYVQGLSYSQIAAVTGTPRGTVMSRLCRGRRHLAALLDGCTG